MVGIDSEDEFGPGLTVDGSVSSESTQKKDPLAIFDQVLAKDLGITEEQAKKVNDIIATVIKGERDGSNAGANKVYPFEDGDVVVLGPEIFSAKDGSVLNWKGVNYVPQKAKDLQPKELKAYTVGEAVEVQKFGNWVPGRITSKQAGILNVDTEFGPVGVGSYHIIRKVQQDG